VVARAAARTRALWLVADVLVVDDDPSTRVLLELHLRAGGHQVRPCATVEEALLASAERRPDLLLLDVDLAGQRGEQLLGLLDRGLGRPTLVCLVSGLEEAELAVVAATHGVQYLTKPLDPADLGWVVAAAVQHRDRSR
jgi:DNA-binding response OmpR family regulator